MVPKGSALSIYTATEKDYPAIVAIQSAETGERWTVERFFAEHGLEEGPHPSARRAGDGLVGNSLMGDGPTGDGPVSDCLVAVTRDLNGGEIVMGFGVAGPTGGSRDGHFRGNIIVAPPYRRRNAGTALLHDLAMLARARGATRLEGIIYDTAPGALEWARAVGVVVEGHEVKVRLPLEGWDSTPFQPALAAAADHGIRFVTLQEAGATEENLQRFHQLCCELEADIPGRGPRLPAYSEWRTRIAPDRGGSAAGAQSGSSGKPAWDPSLVLLAVGGDGSWAGVSWMEEQAGGNLFTHLSAVRRDRRGRGLGLALKVTAANLAKSRGAPSMTSYNHSANTPMVSINRRLGFQTVFGRWQVHFPL